MSLSGYIPESSLSIFNCEDGYYTLSVKDHYFLTCLELSEKVFKQTDGAFDPTVLPLMKIWGFLKESDNIPSQTEIDSTLDFVGFEKGRLWNQENAENKNELVKYDPRLSFDFNAIAQGYSVDVLADFLRKKGCKNFYVEIGGEIYVEGKNQEGKDWKLGVDKPVSTNDGKKQRVISAVISISNKGIATSGNYRKFYEKEGKIYAHTLNPKTGRPAENELLSVTVVAKNTAIADGMATAFMVMGLEKSKEYLKSKDKDGLEVLFIYTGEGNALKSFASIGMQEMMR